MGGHLGIWAGQGRALGFWEVEVGGHSGVPGEEGGGSKIGRTPWGFLGAKVGFLGSWSRRQEDTGGF
jgi:hypothetical protein